MAKESEKPQAPDLKSALKELKKKGTRREAIARIGQIGSPEGVKPLLRLCYRVEDEERAAVLAALAGIGAPAIPPLVQKGLGSKRSRERRCAARALAGMGERAREAVPALLACLDDKSNAVRREAVRTLGQIGDPRAPAVPPLCRVYEGKPPGKETPAAKEEKTSLRLRTGAARALGRAGGAEARACLVRALNDRSFPPELRAETLAALEGTCGEDVLSIAADMAQEEEAEVRRQAARCLCHVDAPASTPHLLGLLDDPDKEVRAYAAEGLRLRTDQLVGRVCAGEEYLLPVLMGVWEGEEAEDEGEETLSAPGAAPVIGAAVIGALVDAGPSIVPILVRFLREEGAQDGSLPVTDAVRALGAFGPEAAEAYDTLIALLDHPRLDTACAAARALGATGDERAIPVLAARLSFDAGLLKARKGAAKRAAKDAVKRAMALQEAVAAGLSDLGKDALPAAVLAARSENPATRRGGMLALGEMGGGRATAALEKGASDADAVVRETAAEMLERTAAHDVERLGRLLRNDDERVRAKAVRALAKLDDLRSLDLLLRAYGDDSKEINALVVEALAQREGARAYSVLTAAAAGGNRTALGVLAEYPRREAIPALLEALDSPWSKVSAAALEAIRAYVDAFEEDPQTMEALRQAVPDLIYLLQDSSGKARRLALETLAALRDPGTVDDIAFLLRDKKERVRYAAVQALASIGSPEAVARLQACMEETEDDDMREEIDEALQEVEEERGPLPEPV